MLAWLTTELALMLAVAAIVRVCYRTQRQHGAARIAKAIACKDQMELLLLLVEGMDSNSVAEWFGEPALIIVVKSFTAECEGQHFLREAVRLLTSHGAAINEPGTEWKTALMHAAGIGNWDLCNLLLSYGADTSAHDLFGRTAADWARDNRHDRIASLLETNA
jgi:ankyrin repeat protein